MWGDVHVQVANASAKWLADLQSYPVSLTSLLRWVNTMASKTGTMVLRTIRALRYVEHDHLFISPLTSLVNGHGENYSNLTTLSNRTMVLLHHFFGPTFKICSRRTCASFSPSTISLVGVDTPKLRKYINCPLDSTHQSVRHFLRRGPWWGDAQSTCNAGVDFFPGSASEQQSLWLYQCWDREIDDRLYGLVVRLVFRLVYCAFERGVCRFLKYQN